MLNSMPPFKKIHVAVYVSVSLFFKVNHCRIDADSLAMGPFDSDWLPDCDSVTVLCVGIELLVAVRKHVAGGDDVDISYWLLVPEKGEGGGVYPNSAGQRWYR